MNSVERVAECRSSSPMLKQRLIPDLDLEVEEEVDKKGIEPPAYWPTKDGSVVVENLTCRYAPQLDPVLRDVSFTIGPKEKIGICGRTGSGKSSEPCHSMAVAQKLMDSARSIFLPLLAPGVRQDRH